VQKLRAEGIKARILTRDPASAPPMEGVRFFSWKALPSALDAVDTVVNLAGAGIADHRWTARRKAELLESRIQSTHALVQAMAAVPDRPLTLVNASAIGYYGAHGPEPVDEQTPPGIGFLPDICQAWEAEADQAISHGVRVVKLRLGVVLTRESGALPHLIAPVRLGLGTRLGSGRQGVSWIHASDLVAMILEAIRSPLWQGAYNAAAPWPIAQAECVRCIADALHRPIWPMPSWISAAGLRLLLGELGKELLLQGAFVLPRKAIHQGFAFRFERFDAALADLLRPVRP